MCMRCSRQCTSGRWRRLCIRGKDNRPCASTGSPVALVRFGSGITSIGSCGTSSTLPDACGTSGAIRRKRACGLENTFCTRATSRELWGRRYNTALPLSANRGPQSPGLPVSKQRRYDAARLLCEFICRLRLALGDLAVWQPPRALLTKWESEELSEREFVFLTICRYSDRDVILRHVTAQRAMEFVPPAKNRAPIGIGLALHNRMMNTVHARRDDDQIQNPFELYRQTPVGMMKERRGFERDEEHE